MPAWWERLDIRRVTILDQLMTEAAKLLFEELGTWPPAVEEVAVDRGGRPGEFSEILAPGSPVPPRAAFVEGIRLARWDLQREFDAFDEYVRNRRWSEAGLDDANKPQILFLASYLTESLLALKEATGGRVKRDDLATALDRLQKRFELAA